MHSVLSLYCVTLQKHLKTCNKMGVECPKGCGESIIREAVSLIDRIQQNNMYICTMEKKENIYSVHREDSYKVVKMTSKLNYGSRIVNSI